MVDKSNFLVRNWILIMLFCNFLSVPSSTIFGQGFTNSINNNSSNACLSCQGKDCCPDCGDPPPACTDCDNTGNITIIASFDPNDIIPPKSVGAEAWVRRDQVLNYMIRFENDPDSATAAAQVVKIYMPLFANADFGNFEVSDFGFGPYYISVPPGQSSYQTRVDARDATDLFVDFEAGIDSSNNRAYWTFTSIDPETGEPTTDPFAGFLPINDTMLHNGEGFVNFRVRPESSAATYDLLDAVANIYFDFNTPIMTPMVLNTIDADAPVSEVNTDVSASDEHHLQLTWGGTDIGSGLATYTIIAAEIDPQSGQMTTFPWLENTDTTAGMFPAKLGYTYRFLSTARDSVGNTEPFQEFEFELVFTEDLLPDPPLPGCQGSSFSVNGNPFIAAGIYRAKNQLDSDSIVPTEDTVMLIAGQKIILLPGFRTEPGSSFNAKIGDCELPIQSLVATPLIKAPEAVPAPFKLSVAPNPFSKQTRINYQLSAAGEVDLIIWNSMGQQVAHPVRNLYHEAGGYQFTWNSGFLTGGIYLITLQAGKAVLSKRVVLIGK